MRERPGLKVGKEDVKRKHFSIPFPDYINHSKWTVILIKD